MKKTIAILMIFLAIVSCTFPALAAPNIETWGLQNQGSNPRLKDNSTDLVYHVLQFDRTYNIDYRVTGATQRVFFDAHVGTTNRSGGTINNFSDALYGTHYMELYAATYAFKPGNYFGTSGEGAANTNATGYLRCNAYDKDGANSEVKFDIFVVQSAGKGSAEVIDAYQSGNTVNITGWGLSYYGLKQLDFYLMETDTNESSDIANNRLKKFTVPVADCTNGYEYAATSKSTAERFYPPNGANTSQLYAYEYPTYPFYQCKGSTSFTNGEGMDFSLNGQYYIAVIARYPDDRATRRIGTTRPVVLASASTPTGTISGTSPIYYGRTNELTCTAGDVNGKASYQWYLNGEAISGATGKTYTMPATMEVGTYSYTCKITNTVTQTGIIRKNNQNQEATVTDKKSYTTAAFKVTVKQKKLVKPTAVTGLVYNGSSQAGVNPTSSEGFSYTSGSRVATNAGNYTTTATLKNNNYCWEDGTEEPVALSWEILPKSLSFTVNANDKTYNGNTAGSGSVILDGVVGADNVTASGTFTFADKNAGTEKNVSVTSIALSGTAAGNYTLSTTTASTTANITKKALTITAKNQTVTYGTAITKAINQVTVATLVSGDSLSAITLTQSTTNAGVGEITPSAATIEDSSGANMTNNYSITYQKGTLTINKKQVIKPTIVNRTYNGAVQYGVNPQTAATGYSYSGTTNATNMGSYTATATLDGNHMWSDNTTGAVSLQWSIAKLGITITAKDQTITYGDSIAIGVAQVMVATLATGDSLTEITLTAGGTNAGTTAITPSVAKIMDGGEDVTNNYNITYKNGNLVIEQKAITPVLVAEDRPYDGTTEADGTITLPEAMVGDDVSATYTKCTFNSSLVGTREATATGIALRGTAAGNYTLASASATDNANITKAVLTVTIVSNLVNTAEEAWMKEKTTQAGAVNRITLPTSYTIGNANGSYGSIADESYTRSGVYYNALGVIEDTMESHLVIENIPCVTVTYHITTGQNAVYGDNSTDAGENTLITTYTNGAGAWNISNKARVIASRTPATAVLNVYLREGEHLLVDTAIGLYCGRMDVTVTKDGATYATDKIDAFFPVNYQDDFRVSKLQSASEGVYNASRKDYWSNVAPFVAEETGVYTFTFNVTGSSYLLDTQHGLGSQYGKDPTNAPANAPVSTIGRLAINGTEQYGIDA